jgi:hypothetical protein
MSSPRKLSSETWCTIGSSSRPAKSARERARASRTRGTVSSSSERASGWCSQSAWASAASKASGAVRGKPKCAAPFATSPPGGLAAAMSLRMSPGAGETRDATESPPKKAAAGEVSAPPLWSDTQNAVASCETKPSAPVVRPSAPSALAMKRPRPRAGAAVPEERAWCSTRAASASAARFGTKKRPSTISGSSAKKSSGAARPSRTSSGPGKTPRWVRKSAAESCASESATSPAPRMAAAARERHVGPKGLDARPANAKRRSPTATIGPTTARSETRPPAKKSAKVRGDRPWVEAITQRAGMTAIAASRNPRATRPIVGARGRATAEEGGSLVVGCGRGVTRRG